MNLEKESQQEVFLLNSMKKLEYINEKDFTEEQKGDISHAKTIIVNNLESLKHNQNINENDFVEIQNIINKYSYQKRLLQLKKEPVLWILTQMESYNQPRLNKESSLILT